MGADYLAHVMSGRKFTLHSEVNHALLGCAAGLVGAGLGAAFDAAFTSSDIVVIGAMDDFGAIGAEERTLLPQLPDLPGWTTEQYWARNEQVILHEAAKGTIFRDASLNPAGTPGVFPSGRFMSRERALLRDLGYHFEQGTGRWVP